jgi:large subunit ribosomal protein L13
VEAGRQWFVVDADGATVGHLATQVAQILRGKHKPIFTPNLDTGDFVVIINAEKVQLTGNKADQKEYFRHSGYPGGGRHVGFRTMIEKHPERVMEHAIRGMLPKNKLGAKMFKKLKVYAGEKHPHQAQNPEVLKIK